MFNKVNLTNQKLIKWYNKLDHFTQINEFFNVLTLMFLKSNSVELVKIGQRVQYL